MIEGRVKPFKKVKPQSRSCSDVINSDCDVLISDMEEGEESKDDMRIDLRALKATDME